MKKICLNMIVKDESAVIRECLDSVRNLIDYWVIVDTGSMDGTQAIIQKCMQGIPGELHERPWIDFAYNRNMALDLAKKKGDYLLFLDADEKLIYSNSFKWNFLRDDCYVAMGKYYQRENIEFGRVLLVNNRLDWEWVGVVHEEIRGLRCQPRNGSILENIWILTDLGGARSKDPMKIYKDAKLLEQALIKEPHNSRAVFYLALSYDVANEAEPALKNYLKRSLMNGNEDEMFYSLYRIARLQELKEVSSKIVMDSYWQAFRFRQSRAEPLYYLAKYLFYEMKNIEEGYRIIHLALKIKQPKDLAFVESTVYQYEMLMLYAQIALRLHRMKEMDLALSQLLTIPTLPAQYRAWILEIESKKE